MNARQRSDRLALALRPPVSDCDTVSFHPGEIDSARLAQVLAAAPVLALMPAPPPSDAVESLDGEVSRIHLTVPRRLLAKLEACKDALSHAMPGASTADLDEQHAACQRDRAGAVHARRGLPVAGGRRSASDDGGHLLAEASMALLLGSVGASLEPFGRDRGPASMAAHEALAVATRGAAGLGARTVDG